MGIAVGLILGVGDSIMRRAWVRVILATNETRDYPLEEGPNRIGSAQGLEVPLFGDHTVDPVQATIENQAGTYFLSSQGSGAGPLLNGQPVRRAAVKDGDEIRIGGYAMQFRQPQAREHYDPNRTVGYAAVADPIPTPVAQHRIIDPFGNISGLAPGLTKIGSDPSAGINVSYDQRVARAHAEIQINPLLAEIRDLGSATGTQVNGNTVTSRLKLSDGDKIRVGDTTFTYRS
jgi:pSer/pThr/pTyr-binding forkhead associated (FHA) protein